MKKSFIYYLLGILMRKKGVIIHGIITDMSESFSIGKTERILPNSIT